MTNLLSTYYNLAESNEGIVDAAVFFVLIV